MDIIKLLTEDHAEVSQLFGRFSRSSKPESQDQLAKEIIHELSVHAAVEETFVYPLLRAKVEAGGELADRSIHEHQEMKRLLSDIEKLDATKAESSRMMDKLSSEVRRHVAEEEREVLPKLRQATDAGLRDKVGSVVEKAKSVVPTHPHPMVPGNAVAQLLAGPWASLVDHARDLVA
jgi:iron-sulfur cluster repair protein YtfE (RIC family)